VTAQHLPLDRPAGRRIALFAFLATVAVGALSAFVLLVATEPASRRTLSLLGGTFLMAVLYSLFLTVPGGVLAGLIAKRVGHARRGRHGLLGWLVVGMSWGGLAGAGCFLAPVLLLPPPPRSPNIAITVALMALIGAVPGATTGAIVALYCRRLQRVDDPR
jgi:hypothetical protein